MTVIADTLRGRFPKRPEFADLNSLLETALSSIDAPKVKKEAIGKSAKLSGSELTRALQRELGREVGPAIRNIRLLIDEGTMAIEQERNALAMQANHGEKLKAVNDREKALALVRATTEIVLRQIRSDVGMNPYEFEHWFATADGTETGAAA